MSIRVMTAVWELDLPSREKLIALAFADHCNDQVSAIPAKSHSVEVRGSRETP